MIVPGYKAAALWALLLAAAATARVHDALARRANADTTIAVWVVFSGRTGDSGLKAVSPRARARRERVGFAGNNRTDRPIDDSYVRQVERLGAVLRHRFRWGNAASFDAHASLLDDIDRLAFVRHVVPVATFLPGTARPGPLRKPVEQSALGDFGDSFRQSDMVNVPLAHEFLSLHHDQSPGQGVLIGLFDTGFWLDHDCFGRLRARDAVVADSDFVGNTGTAMGGYRTHGASVMSTIAGYAPGELVGIAYDARFVLATTEDTSQERHVEEDNYAAALVWAENLGVDIVNSSLGYRYDFDDPDVDYSYDDMDGRTTIVAQATEGALARGVIIVCSMGNDGVQAQPTINSPADGEDVIGVGAIDEYEQVTSFSSTGPTADGRTKPDVVAMGDRVVVLGVDPTRYSRASGTSFSSPITAGVVALVRQAHPGLGAADVRQQVFASCRFALHQDSVDNRYGRGIPDALRACLGENDLYVLAEDSLGNRVPGVRVVVGGTDVGITDGSGTLLCQPSSGLPAEVRTYVPGGDTSVFTLDSLPDYRIVAVAVTHLVVIEVLDEEGRPVSGARVSAQAGTSGAWQDTLTTSAGTAGFALYGDGELRATIAAAGYVGGDTIDVYCDEPICTTTVSVRVVEAERFVVFPTVVRLRDANRELTIEFIREYNAQARSYTASVRSSTGNLLWSTHGETPVGLPLRVQYPCRNGEGRHLGPGTYFVTIECAGRVQVRKFMVAG